MVVSFGHEVSLAMAIQVYRFGLFIASYSEFASNYAGAIFLYWINKEFNYRVSELRI
jgi:hypothetical protein